jgi:hypothetical protein
MGPRDKAVGERERLKPRCSRGGFLGEDLKAKLGMAGKRDKENGRATWETCEN